MIPALLYPANLLWQIADHLFQKPWSCVSYFCNYLWLMSDFLISIKISSLYLSGRLTSERLIIIN